jgi:hypothetical protein
MKYLPEAKKEGEEEEEADEEKVEDCTIGPTQQAEIDDNVSDLIKNLKLGAGMYDYAFWKFYNETNPLLLYDLRVKIFMTLAVHALVIWYTFIDKANTVDIAHPYYGMIGMQMVRMVCSILLHVQMFP